jgi:hypothetical protein
MTRTPGENKESAPLAALTGLARDGVERPSAAELDQGLDVLFARIAVGRTRRRRAWRWSLVGTAGVACALLGLHLISSGRTALPVREPPALSYQIEGGAVLEGGYLRESGHSGIQLLFNEGSRLSLMPGARGRLRSVDKEGARVAIEQGTAAFQVTRSPDRRWMVEVGPFLVTVKGTVFSVSWDPLSERFELDLERGRVVVSGPVSGGDIALRAGQRLVVNLPKAETLITEEPAHREPAPVAPPAPSAPATRPSVVRDKPAAGSLAAPPPSAAAAKSDGERRWGDELLRGHWDRILGDVERTGLQATLDKASSEDLLVLADAARYRRRTDWARAALLAVRRRFPASPRSLDALFLLGRVEETQERSKARAIAWYDEYLARAPTGAYAAEALGRKMTLTSEIAGPADVRPIAEEYLRRFPQGSYAGSARALRRVP